MIIPYKQTLVAKLKKPSTIEERTKILEETGYNAFNFPAMFCVVDYLSDSGSGAMLETQWANLFYGDESYGRNDGYFVLLETLRDVFEREKPKYSIMELYSPKNESKNLISELIFIKKEDGGEGGFFNSGLNQIVRPNTFITPQGRGAEHLLFTVLSKILNEKDSKKKYKIPSNGWFDTTRSNCMQNNIEPVDLFNSHIFDEYPIEKVGKENPFKGNIEIEKLEKFIQENKPENIPLILMTITNNSAGGQIVSLENLKQVKKISEKYDIPFWLDACRFAENAYFIQKYEKGYEKFSIEQIVKEIFKLVDGFHISLKKDGLVNIGGLIAFKDKGKFHSKFSTPNKDIGVLLKEKQISIFGNDSYGGMSGRDIMAVARGLYEVIKHEYLEQRIKQVEELAVGLAKNGIPVLLPPGGHAVYIDINKFFNDRKWSDFAGVGLEIELLRRYAIRTCELGAFAFEWDLRESLSDPLPPNLLRLAFPRNTYGSEHIQYTINALIELYKDKDSIPNMKIETGRTLSLRHFQATLKPLKKQ